MAQMKTLLITVDLQDFRYGTGGLYRLLRDCMWKAVGGFMSLSGEAFLVHDDRDTQWWLAQVLNLFAQSRATPNVVVAEVALQGASCAVSAKRWEWLRDKFPNLGKAVAPNKEERIG